MQRDKRMESQMGSFLRIGVVASCAVMSLGTILYMLRHGGESESF
jgi:uncharacterized membrane protein